MKPRRKGAPIEQLYFLRSDDRALCSLEEQKGAFRFLPARPPSLAPNNDPRGFE